MHYVIGDVHGCYDELQRLLGKINSSDSDAKFIFVGDFIDRGPKVWETLNWMMQNITPGGKYQCVLGNHEDMVIDWFAKVKDNWNDDKTDLPALRYGFDCIAKENNAFSKEKISDIVTFFESLPLSIELSITSPAGKSVNYIIAHAYVPHPELIIEMPESEIRKAYLWSRNHLQGYHGANDTILVHGHTPSLDFDYLVRNRSTRPGMIAYNYNAINVDSGCCYFYTNWREFSPCFLSAICLETLEEFYCDSLEERFAAALKLSNNKMPPDLDLAEAATREVEQYWENLKSNGYIPGEEFYHRNEWFSPE